MKQGGKGGVLYDENEGGDAVALHPFLNREGAGATRQ